MNPVRTHLDLRGAKPSEVGRSDAESSSYKEDDDIPVGKQNKKTSVWQQRLAQELMGKQPRKKGDVRHLPASSIMSPGFFVGTKEVKPRWLIQIEAVISRVSAAAVKKGSTYVMRVVTNPQINIDRVSDARSNMIDSSDV
ncbi:hypothetical protein BHE74_00005509 [Ensete ventricosum]|nr:hypothetical protein BHE74_00005509 [Ensete ventricosum]